MTRSQESKVFLRAEWRHLVMLNYEIDPTILHPLLPAGVKLDQFQGRTLISVVGFLFLRSRLLGLPVPFHGAFEEVNLRFYVRRETEPGTRRGLVFIRELVPHRFVAWTARALYNEPYRRVPMTNEITTNPDGCVKEVKYAWSDHGRPGQISVALDGKPAPMRTGSEEESIAEHYWGYGRQRDGRTLEYQVKHPRWSVCPAASATLECDIAALYGEPFVTPLSAEPTSAFYANGSAIELMAGVPLSMGRPSSAVDMVD